MKSVTILYITEQVKWRLKCEKCPWFIKRLLFFEYRNSKMLTWWQYKQQSHTEFSLGFLKSNINQLLSTSFKSWFFPHNAVIFPTCLTIPGFWYICCYCDFCLFVYSVSICLESICAGSRLVPCTSHVLLGVLADLPDFHLPCSDGSYLKLTWRLSNT